MNIDHIHNGIYLSGSYALKQLDQVRDLGISAVLRLDGIDRTYGQWEGDFMLLDMPFSDGEAVPEGFIERGTTFIRDHLAEGKKVLVHCHMGVSRSVTMVLAYLIEYEGLSLAQAYHLVASQRPIARPHGALLWSLVEYFGLPYDRDDVMSYRFLDRLRRNNNR